MCYNEHAPHVIEQLLQIQKTLIILAWCVYVITLRLTRKFGNRAENSQSGEGELLIVASLISLSPSLTYGCAESSHNLEYYAADTTL